MLRGRAYAAISENGKTRALYEEFLDKLRSMVRIRSGRNESPGMGIIDSRRFMTSHHVDSVQGLDGNKKIKGRKQHMIVDSQGYLMSVAVHEANVHARQVGAKRVIERLWFNFLSAKSCLTKLLCNF